MGRTRILDDPGEQLDPAFDHRLHDHRRPDPRRRGGTVGAVGEMKRDPAVLGLVRAGNPLLTTTGNPSSAAAATASSTVEASAWATTGTP